MILIMNRFLPNLDEAIEAPCAVHANEYMKPKDLEGQIMIVS
jgi:hypothetical protein